MRRLHFWKIVFTLLVTLLVVAFSASREASGVKVFVVRRIDVASFPDEEMSPKVQREIARERINAIAEEIFRPLEDVGCKRMDIYFAHIFDNGGPQAFFAIGYCVEWPTWHVFAPQKENP